MEDLDLDNAQDEYLDALKTQIKKIAAPLIAARDKTVDEAISRAVQYLQAQIDAGNDPTGTVETLAELQFPMPSQNSSPAQVAAIMIKIDDAAQDAVDNNF